MAEEVAVEAEEGGRVWVLLPEAEVLDAVLGSERWMTREGSAREFGEVAAVSLAGELARPGAAACAGATTCGNPALEW